MTSLLTAVGWTWLVVAIATAVPAFGFAAWAMWKRDARAHLLYQGALRALLACAAIAVIVPLALQSEGISRVAEVVPQSAPVTTASASVTAVPRAVAATQWMPDATVAMRLLGAVILVGIVLSGLRLLGGWILVRRLARRAMHRQSTAMQGHVDALRHDMDIKSAVRVSLSDDVGAPMVVGLRPILVMPTELSARLPPELLRPLLAHELAHVLRRDYAINLVQSAVDVVLFACPGARWLSRRVRETREFCCDQRAIEVCGDARRYAAALSGLAALNLARPVLALGAGGPPLASRVARLLEPSKPVPFQMLRVSALLLLSAAAVVVSGRVSVVGARTIVLDAPDQSTQVTAPNGHRFVISIGSYVYEQPGSSVALKGGVVGTGYACDSVTLRNNANVPVKQVTLVAVVESGDFEQPVRIFTSDPIPVAISPETEQIVTARLLPMDQLRPLGLSTTRLQVTCGLAKVDYANGYSWEVTPNLAARTADAALSLPPVQISRALLSSRAPDTGGYYCLDERAGQYSVGAIVPVRYEPGTFARCEDVSTSRAQPAVRWAEYRFKEQR